jgi:hypothetical protein
VISGVSGLAARAVVVAVGIAETGSVGAAVAALQADRARDSSRNIRVVALDTFFIMIATSEAVVSVSFFRVLITCLNRKIVTDYLPVTIIN